MIQNKENYLTKKSKKKGLLNSEEGINFGLNIRIKKRFD
jgi:hypothetical protein